MPKSTRKKTQKVAADEAVAISSLNRIRRSLRHMDGQNYMPQYLYRTGRARPK
jgi:hypothetical protein